MALYIGSVATDWQRDVNVYQTVVETENPDRLHEAIQKSLNERYPGKWRYDVVSEQYLHANSLPGCKVIAKIEVQRSEIEQVERRIEAIRRTIAREQAELEKQTAYLEVLRKVEANHE